LSSGTIARDNASTYRGSGISCGLPTAKFATPGSLLRLQIGPLKNCRNGAIVAASSSVRRVAVVIVSLPVGAI
jgi:hypothetical protein